MVTMEPAKELIDTIERERIERARRTDPMIKFWSGPQLFDMASEWTLAGIYDQHPGISEGEALDLLRKRLDWVEQREARERRR